jgi:general secretion pathway protein K
MIATTVNNAMPRQYSGAALVLVLWLIALLAAMVGAFALNARVEAMQGSALRSSAQAQEVARAGMEYALSRLQASDHQAAWQADGRRYRWRLDAAEVEIRVTDESGKVDVNLANAELLAALMHGLGCAPDRARQLAASIIDWRDNDGLSSPGGGAEDRDYSAAGLPYGAKDGLFESLAELRLVLGMDPTLYRQMLPYVTMLSGRMQPEPQFAAAPVLTAMGLDAKTLIAQRETTSMPSRSGAGSGTYSIESRARLGQGQQGVLRAVVRTGSSHVPGAAYTILHWQEGTSWR